MTVVVLLCAARALLLFEEEKEEEEEDEGGVGGGGEGNFAMEKALVLASRFAKQGQSKAAAVASVCIIDTRSDSGEKNWSISLVDE